MQTRYLFLRRIVFRGRTVSMVTSGPQFATRASEGKRRWRRGEKERDMHLWRHVCRCECSQEVHTLALPFNFHLSPLAPLASSSLTTGWGGGGGQSKARPVTLWAAAFLSMKSLTGVMSLRYFSLAVLGHRSALCLFYPTFA